MSAPPPTSEAVFGRDPWGPDGITPEEYEQNPVKGGWPWCAPGTFPSSYKWEAPCGPDPCIDTHTLWMIVPCVEGLPSATVPNVVPTTDEVLTGDPETVALPFVRSSTQLPATGADPFMIFTAVALIASGMMARLVARR